MNKISSHVELLLGVDSRSLGIFRVSIGAIILYDLFVRSLSLKAHYTDYGVVSRQVLTGLSENPLLMSLNMFSGEVLWQSIIFILAGLAALCLMIGFRSQTASFVCLIMLLSIHVRNPFVNNLGDWFLLNLLYWGTFLPLGTRFSIDSRLKLRADITSHQIFNIATVGMLVQIFALYFFSTFQKTSPIWNTEMSAIGYTLSLDRFVTPIGELVLTMPQDLLKLFTSVVLLLEKWGAILIFFPFFVVPIRFILVTFFILFHLGLFLTLNLGIFPFVCISAWLLLMPGRIWEKLNISSENNENLKSSLNARQLETPDIDNTLTVSFVFNTVLSILLLFSIVSSNLLHIGKMSVAYYEGVYRYVEPMINSLNLRQRWNMFSPHPPRQDGWFIIAGIKEDGTMIDIANDGSRIDWERPFDISATYHNQRWRKNFEWAMTKWDPHSRLLGEYYFRNWNTGHNEEEKISTVVIYVMQEYTLKPAISDPVVRKLLYKSSPVYF